MTRLEELTAQAAIATEHAEKESAVLRQFQEELESDATSLSCDTYMVLQARCSQQERRVEAASHKAAEKQAELDDLRSAETAKLQREMAEKAIFDTLTRLNETRAALESKQRAIRALQNELPTLAGQQNLLLAELDRARTALQRLPSA